MKKLLNEIFVKRIFHGLGYFSMILPVSFILIIVSIYTFIVGSDKVKITLENKSNEIRNKKWNILKL